MKHLSLLIVLLFALGGLGAQDVALEAKIKELLELSGAKQQFVTFAEGMIDQYRNNPAMAGELPEEFFDEFADEIREGAFESLEPRLVQVYLDNYTEEEIDHQLAYLRHPLTQGIVAKTPVVMQQSMQIGREWGMQLGEQIGRRLMEAQEDKN